MPFMKNPLVVILAAALLFVGACDDHKHDQPAAGTTAKEHGHVHGPNGEHTAPSKPQADHSGPVIQLGTATAGAFTVRATRDAGKIEAGKEAPIDTVID